MRRARRHDHRQIPNHERTRAMHRRHACTRHLAHDLLEHPPQLGDREGPDHLLGDQDRVGHRRQLDQWARRAGYRITSVGSAYRLRRTPLAGTVAVPAAKRNVAWDEVIRSTRAKRAATAR